MKEFKPREPKPDFQAMEAMIKGEIEPEKVRLAELVVDFEVIAWVLDKLFNEKMMTLAEAYHPDEISASLKQGKGVQPMAGEKERLFWKQYASFFYRMGYDFVTDLGPMGYLLFMTTPSLRIADDTAELSRGKRLWAEEGRGKIASWDDFERFNWDGLKLNLEAWAEFWESTLPEGMKIAVNCSLYEQVLERLMGYEGLFYNLVDQPDLVKAVFDKWGEIVEGFYLQAIKSHAAGLIFHSDDLGYKSRTMISPDQLREYVFPWFKRYAQIAHSEGKMFWLHSCGNLLGVMDDLIDHVGIDAFHSFQDQIIPVAEFKREYGHRVAALGGVDVDNLARMDEQSLRACCRGVLSGCMPGRYAFGSGNSITNYMPVSNYLAMLEEAGRFKV